VDVNDVVPALAKHATHVAPQMPTQRDAGLGAVGIHRLAATQPDDVRLFLRPWNMRRNDVDVMAAPAGLASKEVDVLADAAKVRVVVLRNQRNTQRPLVALELERR
jgi:hypothetical protein